MSVQFVSPCSIEYGQSVNHNITGDNMKVLARGEANDNKISKVQSLPKRNKHHVLYPFRQIAIRTRCLHRLNPQELMIRRGL